MHSNYKLVLLFLYVIFSCESKKVSEKTESIKSPENQDKIVEETKSAIIHRDDLIIKKEEFPCFETSLIKKRTTFVDLGSIYTKNDINTFRRLVESTYLNFYYLQSLYILFYRIALFFYNLEKIYRSLSLNPLFYY